jgi:hypothetical protein
VREGGEQDLGDDVIGTPLCGLANSDLGGEGGLGSSYEGATRRLVLEGLGGSATAQFRELLGNQHEVYSSPHGSAHAKVGMLACNVTTRTASRLG